MIFRKMSMPIERAWLNQLENELGRAEASQFMARVESRVQSLLHRSGTYPKSALQKFHLEANILPALALYQEFLLDGMKKEDAIAKTGEYLDLLALKLRRRFQLLARMPFFFEFLKRRMCPSMERNFPAPGFELEWPKLGKNTTGFNVLRCFYVDVLGTFGASELTRLFCDVDDVVFENTPGVRWKRGHTIGRGGSYCDFRYIKE